MKKNVLIYWRACGVFAIYNHKTNQMFLARDRFGEKPLLYSNIDGNFIFGSEVKFIKSLSKKLSN